MEYLYVLFARLVDYTTPPALETMGLAMPLEMNGAVLPKRLRLMDLIQAL